jgi:hypothetical protein
MWVTDKRRIDSSISTVALEMIERLNKQRIERGDIGLVLHSVHQVGCEASPLPQNARTAMTIIKEAMYQTLSSTSDLWLKYVSHQEDDPFKQTSLKQLFTSFSQLLDLYCTATTQATESMPRAIYWIIDRVDTAFWATGKGLSDSPHRNQFSKSESLHVCANSVALDDLLRLLEAATSQKKGQKWILKVLVTSHYDHDTLNRAYGGRPRSDEEDDEEVLSDGEHWVEILV